MNRTACPGCGSSFPDIEGPTHPYLLASPGCWSCYGEVLNREYSDIRYYRLHRLTVDAYAVQHPGEPNPQSIQSVALHLISLYCVLERSVEPTKATSIMQRASKKKGHFFWLNPPDSRGDLTVAAVGSARSPGEHVDFIRSWAESAWNAWSIHHEQVEQWYSSIWKEV